MSHKPSVWYWRYCVASLLAITAFGVLLLGIYPYWVLRLAESAVTMFSP